MRRLPRHGIFPLVRFGGFLPLSPLSWTPPHTLGGAVSAALFLLMVRIFPDSFCQLTSSKIHLYRASSTTGRGAHGATGGGAMRVNDSKSSGAGTILLRNVAISLARLVGTLV